MPYTKFALLLGTAALIAGSVHAQTNAPTTSGGAEATTADIVVTASKREEKLRDVPATITALSGATLDNLGVRDFRDYATLVPGLSQRDSGAPGQGTIILRGLNSGAQQTTNTTAFYVDDTPFSASGFFSYGGLTTVSPDLLDVERLEVLKGPQGTLYGASSLGGLVRVITKKADPSSFSGVAQIEGETLAHGNEGWSARAAINAPIVIDKLAVRLSGFYRKLPGWIDNVADGERDTNTATIKGGRIAVRATPADRLTIDLTGFYQDINSNGNATEDLAKGTLRPLYGDYKASFVPGSTRTNARYRSIAATASYDIDVGSFVSSAGYVSTKASQGADFSTNYGTYLAAVGLVPANTQAVVTVGPQLKKFTAEARFVSKRLGPIEFVAGGFYTHENSQYPELLIARNAAGVPLAAPKAVLLQVNPTGIYAEYAAFGNLTFYLTDRLDVTGGLRYAHNNQTADRAVGTIFYAPSPLIHARFSDNSTTYLATLRYRPTSNISLYARAASGYRPGGPQTNPNPPAGAQTVIKADTVWNYEAGIKVTALNGALSANLAAYRIDWKNIQVNSLYGGILLLGNAAKARVDGFELEVQAHPTRNFVLGGNLGRTNPRLTAVDPGASTSLGASAGDKLPLTPGWMAAGFVDQTIPLSNDLKGSLGATVRHQSHMPSGFPADPTNPNISIPSITTVDLRAGLALSRYIFQLRVENLFNTHRYTTVTTNALYAGQAVPTEAVTTRPRAIIFSATAHF